MFDRTSRYQDLETATITLTDPDGRPRNVPYKRRRLIPCLEEAETLVEHAVAEGERLDAIAARYLGDPRQFWRLCDPIPILHPRDLELVGRIIRIVAPEERGR